MNCTQKYINKYGKKHEKLIINCLNWLDRNESLWNLSQKINKDNFIKQIIEKVEMEHFKYP